MFSQHVTRKRDAAVPIAGKTVRLVAVHGIGDFKVFERAVDDTLLLAVSGDGIDRRVAVASEAGLCVPDRCLGHVVRVESPVPVARG
jgi:hypothetical protein